MLGKTSMYVDFANVRPWSEKLKWHVDVGRLKQFLDSFDNIATVKWYQGELAGSEQSAKEMRKLQKSGYVVRTKPVTIRRISIDATSVSRQSPDLLKSFVRGSLLRKYDIATVEYLNGKFADLNARGELYIEDRKCNFDVEIGADMRVDHLTDSIETFVLWSGDSDFADPIRTLMQAGKRVVLFATAGRVSRELGELTKEGLYIFDIADIRDFVCRTPEQTVQVQIPAP